MENEDLSPRASREDINPRESLLVGMAEDKFANESPPILPYFLEHPLYYFALQMKYQCPNSLCMWCSVAQWPRL